MLLKAHKELLQERDKAIVMLSSHTSNESAKMGLKDVVQVSDFRDHVGSLIKTNLGVSPPPIPREGAIPCFECRYRSQGLNTETQS